MTREYVAEKVVGVICDQCGCCMDEVSFDDHLVQDLDCDDFTLIEVVIALEEEFDTTFPDELDLRTMTVNDLIDAMCEAVGVTP